MSTEWIEQTFGVPEQAGADPSTVREILRELFDPDRAVLLPTNLDLSLRGHDGAPLDAVLAAVRESVVRYAVKVRHPLALAHMVPPPATVSVMADLLIGAMNQCAFIWEEAPVAARVEEEVIRWMADRLRYQKGAGGILTSGGTMSNCLALYLALKRAKGTYRPGGPYCIVASDQAHLSLEKAAALNGLDRGAVRRVPTDDEGRLRPGSFMAAAEIAAREGWQPALVVCTAGTTSTGALESIEEALCAARQLGTWCHLDAAHGGILALSRSAPPEVSRWCEADSVSWDPHKSMYVSYATGALLVRDQATLSPLEFHGEYALKKGHDSGEEVDAGVRHFEGSRRFEALKTWMTIKYFGVVGFANVVDHSLALAQYLAERIAQDPAFELVTSPDTNIVCFRYVGNCDDESRLAAVNVATQEALFRRGGPLLSSTKVGGRDVLRAVLLNPRTRFTHCDELMTSVRAEAERQLATVSPALSVVS